LRQEADIERLFTTAGKFGKARVLINSASLFERRPLGALTATDVQKTLSVNLTAPMLTSRYFVELLKADGLECRTAVEPFAKIINLADVAATKPWAEYAAYCASKAGLVGLTTALAKELAPGITVNAVAPGIVTWPEPMTAVEEQKQIARIPAGRFGRPAEIVKSIVFLLENDYISGQTLCVDGGRGLI
jgi:NAD(P)-dependent dehydrogenase (short-subunit alcohol dehydrogenase family)